MLNLPLREPGGRARQTQPHLRFGPSDPARSNCRSSRSLTLFTCEMGVPAAPDPGGCCVHRTLQTPCSAQGRPHGECPVTVSGDCY